MKQSTFYNMKTLIIIISIISILFYSCSTKIDLDEPKSDSQVVVFGLIQADSSVTVNLSFTQSFLEDSDVKYIENAKITLYENDIQVESLQYKDSGNYKSVIKAKSKTEYKISVEVPGYELITASTYIPDYVYIYYGNIKPDSYFDQQQLQYESEITITFNDNAETKNYYQSSFYSYTYGGYAWDNETNTFLITDSTKHYTSTSFLYSIDPVIVNEGDLQFYGDGLYISSLVYSDKLLTINNQIKFLVYGLGEGSSFPHKSVAILKNISFDFYLYQKSWIRQSFNQGMGSFDATNMFLVNNPNDLYTNIKNGIGIFAGFTETQFELEEINASK